MKEGETILLHDTEQEFGRKAKKLPLKGGSLTFRGLVLNRDWEAVASEAPLQKDSFHGVPTLTVEDWAYLRAEAAKDGWTL